MLQDQERLRKRTQEKMTSERLGEKEAEEPLKQKRTEEIPMKKKKKKPRFSIFRLRKKN